MKTNFMHPVIAVAALFAIAGPLSRSRAAEPEVMTMRNSNLKLTVGAHVLTAALEDNASSRDFVISDLPKRLSTQGAPEGSVPRIGDVAYYAPWGNLAIFHKDFKYSSGLIKIAHLAGDIAALTTDGPVTVRIELATLDRAPR